MTTPAKQKIFAAFQDGQLAEAEKLSRAQLEREQEDEELVVAAEAVEGEPEDEGAVDQDELLRKLEEFKREMFTNE